ncbi:cytochrome P450 [Nocardia sp. alder85J]|uniref:cytochrome P450 n=1 Tax=Nocardia sp. alder85J TaxID=2862949 RepID=UPI001CD68422|nr:cytochrome P450 [Nocardia sp. alder85J]MCX4098512.1 cytochrome P450 [Nocardia sp. alder85J]
MTSMLQSSFMQESARMAPEHGPVFARRLFNLEFTFVTGAELVAELADDNRFEKHVVPALQVVRPLIGDGLLSAHNHEPTWHTAHDLLIPAFSQTAMRHYHTLMTEVCGRLTDSWDRSAREGGSVDVTASMAKVTLEIIGRTGFGYSFGSFDRDTPHPFVTALDEVLDHGQRSVTSPAIAGRFLGKRMAERNNENVTYLRDVVDEVIARRSRGDHGTDLLGLMLDSDVLDPVNIRYQVLTFLAAGHETTSAAMSFTLYYLAANPGIAERARAEAESVLAAPEPQFADIARLRYLRRVIDESLRLWPTAPGYARKAKADTVLGGRYPMPAGEPFFVLLPALHREPVWGADTDAFDPDRFLPERVRARPPHSFKPFGTGMRACIGRQFALHQIALVIATILRRYDLALPTDYRLTVAEGITFSPVDLTLNLSPRRA